VVGADQAADADQAAQAVDVDQAELSAAAVAGADLA